MSIRMHRVRSVSLLTPVANDPPDGQQVDPPPPVVVPGEEEYQVWSVEDSQVYQDQLRYLI